MERRMHNRHWLLIIALPALVLPLLACGTGGLATQRAARWACPSPTPLPYGETGPIKREWQECTTDPLTGEQHCETHRAYYTEWEQEYGAAFSPPFPSPTPYAIKGTTFLLGQRVEVGQFHVTVSASAGAVVERPGVPAGTQQLFFVNITWLSHADAPVPISYAERVKLRSVREPSGGVITGSSWGVTAESLQLAELDRLPDRIPTGESSVRIPIIGPVGEPVTVEIIFDSGALPPADGTPTATPPPNDDLRRQEPGTLTVQWTEGSLRDIGPSCDDQGVITPWGDGRYISWGRDVAIGMPAPPGADRLIQVVLNQVGKPYVWGAKGPETFDCSGLASWSYGQIGIRIPQGTAGQWPQMRVVDASDLQPGDLVFFDMEGLGQIDHVGILLGDLDGDGRWDMEHAANPNLGVRVDYGIFESAYYTPRIRGFRTAR
jgi:cell wall-associated NlpC family hydrolase